MKRSGAIGSNTMDVRRRPAVARAGMAQGKTEAALLAAFLG